MQKRADCERDLHQAVTAQRLIVELWDMGCFSLFSMVSTIVKDIVSCSDIITI